MIAALLLLLPALVRGESPQSAVIRLVKHKIVGPLVLTKYGTAWCLTGTCDYVVTNYHVAALFGNPIKYDGTKTAKKGVFLGTGERDYGARRIPLEMGGWQRYNPVRDVAILKFERPIPEHGAPAIFTGELEENEAVVAFSFPKGGRLRQQDGTYLGVFEDGELAFRIPNITSGCSGGLIVNQRGEAVGLLRAVNGDIVAAVPVWSVVEVARKSGLPFPEVKRPAEQPAFGESVSEDDYGVIESTGAPFSTGGVDPRPALPPGAVAGYLRESIAPLPTAHSGDNHHRKREPETVVALRQRAQQMADQMSSLVSVETAVASGYHQDDKFYQDEIRIVAGRQIFKSFKDARERTERLPPLNGTFFGSLWYDLLRTIGTKTSVRIEPKGHMLIGKQSLQVFQFEASPEDDVCSLKVLNSYGFGITATRVYRTACRGEIWTDASANILRISEQLDVPPDSGWSNLSLAILYGWILGPDGAQRLVPYSAAERITQGRAEHEYF